MALKIFSLFSKRKTVRQMAEEVLKKSLSQINPMPLALHPGTLN